MRGQVAAPVLLIANKALEGEADNKSLPRPYFRLTHPPPIDLKPVHPAQLPQTHAAMSRCSAES